MRNDKCDMENLPPFLAITPQLSMLLITGFHLKGLQLPVVTFNY